MAKYLIKQYNTYSAVLPIPKELQLQFGKKRFKQSLKTGDKALAQIKAFELVSQWKADLMMARQQDPVEWNLKQVWDKIPPDGTEYPFEDDDGTEHWIPYHDKSRKATFEAEAAWHYSDHNPDGSLKRLDYDIQEAVKVVSGEYVRLSDYVTAYLASLEVEEKTRDMRGRDINNLLKDAKFKHEVTPRMVKGYLAKHPDIAVATKRRWLSSWSGFWKWLEFELDVEMTSNPFEASRVLPQQARVKTKKQVEDVRQSFTVSQIEQLYHNAPDQVMKDLIQIGAYTGMRIEEICSGYVLEGDCFEVVKAKTEAGLRLVPIHPALTPELLHRWEASRAAMPENKYGIRSDAISKRFGRYRTKQGFDHRYVFHSIRKTVAAEFKRLAPDQERIAANILGHEWSTQTEGYAGSVEEPKRKLINQLHYNFKETEMQTDRYA